MRSEVSPQTDANLAALIRMALREDLGRAGDLTTRHFLPPRARLRGAIVAKQAGVVCGLDVVRQVCAAVSPRIRFKAAAKDGARVAPLQVVALLEGPPALLTAERTALNFLQRLSGVATMTRAFVDLARGTRARILDTRKTVPGWRALDKYAVRCGGGENHRFGLYDMVMLKDNHLAPGPELVDATRRFRRRRPGVPVLVEAKTAAEVELALACRPDILLLDNVPLARLKAAIARVRARAPRVRVEVSGGVRLDTVRAIARAGPDRISVGALTHSAPAMDFSLEIDPASPDGRAEGSA
ncbi:MAG: carboxylating nicotinate-nucleotide diphosphorylase [Elusimicrobia bacterium]|nr:carboxylating nicotinate-nucleotide diphosphorylase [Elusimicrobiota bacterium]